MPKLKLKYGAHIFLLTGKMQETINLQGTTVEDLLQTLDKTYPGIYDIFVPPDSKILNLRSAIFLERKGESTQSIIDKAFNFSDGDALFLW